jgi:hypothetical protein
LAPSKHSIALGLVSIRRCAVKQRVAKQLVADNQLQERSMLEDGVHDTDRPTTGEILDTGSPTTDTTVGDSFAGMVAGIIVILGTGAEGITRGSKVMIIALAYKLIIMEFINQ